MPVEWPMKQTKPRYSSQKEIFSVVLTKEKYIKNKSTTNRNLVKTVKKIRSFLSQRGGNVDYFAQIDPHGPARFCRQTAVTVLSWWQHLLLKGWTIVNRIEATKQNIYILGLVADVLFNGYPYAFVTVKSSFITVNDKHRLFFESEFGKIKRKPRRARCFFYLGLVGIVLRILTESRPRVQKYSNLKNDPFL